MMSITGLPRRPPAPYIGLYIANIRIFIISMSSPGSHERTPECRPCFPPDMPIRPPDGRRIPPVCRSGRSPHSDLILLALSSEIEANSQTESICRPVFALLQGGGSLPQTRPRMGNQPPPIFGIR